MATKVLHDESKPDKEKEAEASPAASPPVFKYPLTMPEDGKGYPGSIRFQAKKIDGIDITGAIGSLFDKLGRNKGINQETDATDGTDADKRAAEEATKNSTQVEDPTGTTDALAPLLTSHEDKSQGELVGTVVLPLQRDLRFSDNVAYETANLGIIAPALGAGIKGLSELTNPFSGGTNGDGSFSQGAAGLAAQAAAKAAGVGISAFIGKKFGSGFVGAALGAGLTEGISSAVKDATRIASTPNQRTMFKEVQLRQFAFAFKMVANSKEEAEQVKNIIKFFRTELYPEKITYGSAGLPLAYKFPNVFEIEVRNQFGNDAASKIQRCYLRDVQTSYNGTGNGLHIDGNFVEVDISLSFQEIAALDKLKVSKEGF
jgi:hypothetical protein